MKRRRCGCYLLNESEVDLAADRTPHDVARARRRWHEGAPEEFADFLEAEPIDDSE
ncbi:MAG TPA: hypothetical protein VNS11_07355 [Sphingomicrobium sp.]|nr:hypothetical protein [Sphingomicrobium sp.]